MDHRRVSIIELAARRARGFGGVTARTPGCRRGGVACARARALNAFENTASSLAVRLAGLSFPASRVHMSAVCECSAVKNLGWIGTEVEEAAHGQRRRGASSGQDGLDPAVHRKELSVASGRR